MKLRLRSLESKQTHRIEIPNSANLQQLKEFINSLFFPSSSSSSSATQGNLLLSLNRKDELYGSSPQQSLQSLGVTSGDLIYFSRNPFAFSSQSPNLSHEKPVEINDRSSVNVELGDTQKVEFGKNDEIGGSSEKSCELLDTQMEKTPKLSNPNDENRDLVNTQMVESDNLVNLGGSSAQTHEIVDAQMGESSKLSDPSDENENLVNLEKGKLIKNDDDNDDDGMEVDDGKGKFSVPSFLKKVFVKEVGDAANGGNHKLLVIAVHAVLLESGFVGYDPLSGMKVDGFHLHDEWPSSAFGITLHYTLPEVSSSEVVETVAVKFQTMGKYVNVYGSLAKNSIRSLSLDEPRFVPALNFVWKMSDHIDSENERSNGSMKLYADREIFEFWKIVKDGLSYPLLIELCEKMGLVLPPSFMRLPTELKLKILESLPAVDVARVACVCSELRFVSSNNDLWRLKYEEEFGSAKEDETGRPWKAKFFSEWDSRKKRKRECISPRWFRRSQFLPAYPGWRDRNPFGFPFVIGGDYDRTPLFGVPPVPSQQGRRTFRSNCDPHCDLGGFGPVPSQQGS